MIRRSNRRMIALFTAAAIGSALVSAGGATAAGLITSAQIKNGTIQTADMSAKARAALRGATGSTGATGQTGARGPAGLQGVAGTNGTNGASAGVFLKSMEMSSEAISNEAGTVETVNLTAGSWILSASGVVRADETTAHVQCAVLQGGELLGVTNNTTMTEGEHETLTISTALVLTGAASIELSCADGGGGARISNVYITAIQVQTLSDQSPEEGGGIL